MLGSRLASRIVLPVLGLLALLFALLGVVAYATADARVREELDSQADRIATTLDGLALPREQRAPILHALAGLVGCEIVIGEDATVAGWDAAALASIRAASDGAEIRVGGSRFHVRVRPLSRRPERIFVLSAAEAVERRHRDVLVPIVLTAAAGVTAAGLLGLWVARTIARPVRHLAEQTRAFAEGRFEPGDGPAGPGEIGELQESFRRMAAAIREGEARLRESERFAALGRLAGGIAHELRNPLTAIRMAVESSADSGEEQRAEASRVALAEIGRLDRTLGELLDYVRPRPLSRTPVSLAALFEDVAALLRPQCEHLGVRLEISVRAAGGAEDIVVEADADRLKQALLNLVLNGAQAQVHGGVVRLRGLPDRIEVEDEGPGIPESVREKLFEPFVTTRAAGIGLGLAVVARVAEEHGFDLDFHTGGEGTVFVLSFASA